jgi:hypothetical protein
MEFKGRQSFYVEGCYIRCEGTFFIWVDSTTLLHYRREFFRVEITCPFEPSKGMYVEYMILLLHCR